MILKQSAKRAINLRLHLSPLTGGTYESVCASFFSFASSLPFLLPESPQRLIGIVLCGEEFYQPVQCVCPVCLCVCVVSGISIVFWARKKIQLHTKNEARSIIRSDPEHGHAGSIVFAVFGMGWKIKWRQSVGVDLLLIDFTRVTTSSTPHLTTLSRWLDRKKAPLMETLGRLASHFIVY